MSVRPMSGQPNPARGGDGRRFRWSESPIPGPGAQRVRAAGAVIVPPTWGPYDMAPADCWGQYAGSGQAAEVAPVGGVATEILADADEGTYLPVFRTADADTFPVVPDSVCNALVGFDLLDISPRYAGGEYIDAITVDLRCRLTAGTLDAYNGMFVVVVKLDAGTQPDTYTTYTGADYTVTALGASWETLTFTVTSPDSGLVGAIDAGTFGIALQPFSSASTAITVDVAEIGVTLTWGP